MLPPLERLRLGRDDPARTAALPAAIGLAKRFRAARAKAAAEKAEKASSGDAGTPAAAPGVDAGQAAPAREGGSHTVFGSDWEGSLTGALLFEAVCRSVYRPARVFLGDSSDVSGASRAVLDYVNDASKVDERLLGNRDANALRIWEIVHLEKDMRLKRSDGKLDAYAQLCRAMEVTEIEQNRVFMQALKAFAMHIDTRGTRTSTSRDGHDLATSLMRCRADDMRVCRHVSGAAFEEALQKASLELTSSLQDAHLQPPEEYVPVCKAAMQSAVALLKPHRDRCVSYVLSNALWASRAIRFLKNATLVGSKGTGADTTLYAHAGFCKISDNDLYGRSTRTETKTADPAAYFLRDPDLPDHGIEPYKSVAAWVEGVGLRYSAALEKVVDELSLPEELLGVAHWGRPPPKEGEEPRIAHPSEEETRIAHPSVEETRIAHPSVEETRIAHPSAEETRIAHLAWPMSGLVHSSRPLAYCKQLAHDSVVCACPDRPRTCVFGHQPRPWGRQVTCTYAGGSARPDDGKAGRLTVLEVDTQYTFYSESVAHVCVRDGGEAHATQKATSREEEAPQEEQVKRAARKLVDTHNPQELSVWSIGVVQVQTSADKPFFGAFATGTRWRVFCCQAGQLHKKMWLRKLREDEKAPARPERGSYSQITTATIVKFDSDESQHGLFAASPVDARTTDLDLEFGRLIGSAAQDHSVMAPVRAAEYAADPTKLYYSLLVQTYSSDVAANEVFSHPQR